MDDSTISDLNYWLKLLVSEHSVQSILGYDPSMYASSGTHSKPIVPISRNFLAPIPVEFALLANFFPLNAQFSNSALLPITLDISRNTPKTLSITATCSISVPPSAQSELGKEIKLGIDPTFFVRSFTIDNNVVYNCHFPDPFAIRISRYIARSLNKKLNDKSIQQSSSSGSLEIKFDGSLDSKFQISLFSRKEWFPGSVESIKSYSIGDKGTISDPMWIPHPDESSLFSKQFDIDSFYSFPDNQELYVKSFSLPQRPDYLGYNISEIAQSIWRYCKSHSLFIPGSGIRLKSESVDSTTNIKPLSTLLDSEDIFPFQSIYPSLLNYLKPISPISISLQNTPLTLYLPIAIPCPQQRCPPNWSNTGLQTLLVRNLSHIIAESQQLTSPTKSFGFHNLDNTNGNGDGGNNAISATEKTDVSKNVEQEQEEQDEDEDDLIKNTKNDQVPLDVEYANIVSESSLLIEQGEDLIAQLAFYRGQMSMCEDFLSKPIDTASRWLFSNERSMATLESLAKLQLIELEPEHEEDI